VADAMRDVAFVALGSNLGDRMAHLATARAALAGLPATRVLAATEPEETAPVGPVEQGTFVNQMVALETSLAPLDLLDRLMEIERAAGRERTVRWGPRTLDLDIVLFAQQTVAHPRLTVPHPELANRDWWMRELAELHAALGTDRRAAASATGVRS
jgi:2-amino-4-hydroxy-6-hydroxymethyldihydropteridine diphosphokinase